jgi:hypothetical protein
MLGKFTFILLVVCQQYAPTSILGSMMNDGTAANNNKSERGWRHNAQ